MNELVLHGNKKTHSEQKPCFPMGLETSGGNKGTLKDQVPGRKDVQRGEHPHVGWAPGQSTGAQRGKAAKDRGTDARGPEGQPSLPQQPGSGRWGNPLGKSWVISYKIKHTCALGAGNFTPKYGHEK